MDDLDLDILRWMYPGGVWSPWGSDPRIGVAEIASHVGLDRTAVWARMRKWRRDGFWDGFQTHVNARIFGIGMLFVTFRVADSAEGWDLLDRVGEIEGVVGASLHFGDSLVARDVEHVGVTMVAGNSAEIFPRMEALRQISPSGVVDGPVVFEPPPCSRELSDLDWRILSVMVDYPNASVPRAAGVVGVSPKTFTHHRSALIDDHVVSSAPKLDWSKMGCVTLGFYCNNAPDVEGARQAVESRVPHSIPVSLAGLEGIAPEFESSKCFSQIVPAHSPHEVQTLVRDLSGIRGVKMVRPELWGPQREFSGWVRQRIAENLASPANGRLAVAPGRLGGYIRARGPPVRHERRVLASP